MRQHVVAGSYIQLHVWDVGLKVSPVPKMFLKHVLHYCVQTSVLFGERTSHPINQTNMISCFNGSLLLPFHRVVLMLVLCGQTPSHRIGSGHVRLALSVPDVE